MTVIIDLFGSAIVAGYVILIGLRLNIGVGSTVTAATANVNIQEAMANTVTIIESDFKKIGYGVTDATLAIALADSNRIRFFADLDRDGAVDSVEWYVGNVVTKSADLQVRTLYRKLNNLQPSIVASGVTRFKITYLDQDGVETLLPSQVAMLETTVALTSLYKVADQVNPDSVGYVNTLLRQGRLSTRNIRRHG